MEHYSGINVARQWNCIPLELRTHFPSFSTLCNVNGRPSVGRYLCVPAQARMWCHRGFCVSNPVQTLDIYSADVCVYIVQKLNAEKMHLSHTMLLIDQLERAIYYRFFFFNTVFALQLCIESLLLLYLHTASIQALFCR